MRIDAHVHVFPPALPAGARKALQEDLTYRTLYASPKAALRFRTRSAPRSTGALATAEALVESMDKSGIERAVLANIGWTTMALCRETNDYILDAARRFPERLTPLCSVNPAVGREAIEEVERCARQGARGIGELHPDTQGFDLGDAATMRPIVEAAAGHDMVILAHASEPVGHEYPGKGQVTPQVAYRFVTNFPQARIVLAHWGGGLPFYALMPEVRKALTNVWFDTAASPFLYEPQVFEIVMRLAGAEKILFGTDFPLIKHERLLRQVEGSGLSPEAKALVLGGNAARVFGIK